MWTVYLAGEVHSDWRDRIEAGVTAAGLSVALCAPVTNHGDSDDCGAVILGEPCDGHEANAFWRDRLGASLNAVRTRTLLKGADIVVARFGEQYRQWNAAFDAGRAVAAGTPLITLHDASLDHALKEVDAAALVVCRTTDQVVDALAYAITGVLKRV
jgi:YtoQ family protein